MKLPEQSPKEPQWSLQSHHLHAAGKYDSIAPITEDDPLKNELIDNSFQLEGLPHAS
jgi:hypothetical protein